MKEWFVLRTEFSQEQRARMLLSASRIKTFLPLGRTESRRKDGLLVAKIKPLFPRYIFVFLDWFKSKHVVLSTKHVKFFVGYYEGMVKAPVVPKPVMEELQSRLEEINGWDVVNLSSRPKEISVNDMVHILFGPYRDRIAPVRAVLDQSRVEVLLQFANRDLSVTLHKDCLRAA